MIRFFLLVALSYAYHAHGRVAFEAFYRIERRGKHIGYSVQRDEIDESARTRTLKYSQWLKEAGRISQFGVVTVSRIDNEPSRLSPLRYTAMEVFDGAGSRSDGQFDKRLSVTRKLLNPNFTAGAKLEEFSEAVPKHTIFSSLATHWFFMNNKPLKMNEPFSFSGFHEERAQFAPGKLTLKSRASNGGLELFRLHSDFGDEELDVFTLVDGQPVATNNSGEEIRSYTVPRDQAIGEFDMKQGRLLLEAVFGDVPRGIVNPVVEKKLNLNLLLKGISEFGWTDGRAVSK